MDLDLEGLTVLITGASGGLGRAMAKGFAAEGANLVLHANSNAKSVKAQIESNDWGDRALAVAADVSNAEEITTAFGEAVKRFGRIDICIANAGMWPPEDVPLHKMTSERLQRTVAVNLIGASLTAREFLKQLAKAGPRVDERGSSLTFIGSTAGRFGERGHVDYAISKAGLYGLVRSLKNEIVNIDPCGRVNMVEPGWTVTEMAKDAIDEPGAVERIVRTMPLRQLGKAKDIANSVLFLSSPAVSGHVSGEVLTVAGGMEGRVIWDLSQVDTRRIRRRLDL